MRSFIPLSLLSLLQVSSTFAVRFPFRVRTDPALRPRHDLHARANGSEGIKVTNTQNVQYIGNISLGGSQFDVVLDTGRLATLPSQLTGGLGPDRSCFLHSSDLWVAGTVPNSQDTGTSVTLSYAIGQANGEQCSARVLQYHHSCASFIFQVISTLQL